MNIIVRGIAEFNEENWELPGNRGDYSRIDNEGNEEAYPSSQFRSIQMM